MRVCARGLLTGATGRGLKPACARWWSVEGERHQPVAGAGLLIASLDLVDHTDSQSRVLGEKELTELALPGRPEFLGCTPRGPALQSIKRQSGARDTVLVSALIKSGIAAEAFVRDRAEDHAQHIEGGDATMGQTGPQNVVGGHGLLFGVAPESVLKEGLNLAHGKLDAAMLPVAL